jgi:hypothetical protein
MVNMQQQNVSLCDHTGQDSEGFSSCNCALKMKGAAPPKSTRLHGIVHNEELQKCVLHSQVRLSTRNISRTAEQSLIKFSTRQLH